MSRCSTFGRQSHIYSIIAPTPTSAAINGSRERIRRAGHTVIGYDRNPDVADVHSLKELVDTLKGPRVVWVMVPSGAATQSTIDELAGLLSPGDIVVDGGNSRWTDDEKHGEENQHGEGDRERRAQRRRLHGWQC